MEDKLLFTMWEIVVVLMVIIALTVAVRGIANNTVYWKKYHSTDLALMTDLLMINQGDFVLNYELKDIERNIVTDGLMIDPLRLNIVLRDNAYFIYDGTPQQDRFPQNYIFATDSDIKIINSEIASDYVVLYKEGNSFSLRNDYIAKTISCPSIDTKGNIAEMHFEVMAIEDSLIGRARYATELLKTPGTTNDLLIAISEASEVQSKNIIYYDTSNKAISEKMGCIIMRKMLESNPDLKIEIRPFDSSIISENEDLFESKKSGYRYFVVMDFNSGLFTDQEFSKHLEEAIKEFYG
ncbi:MAG TPA: hypothetical protein VEC16_01900 [Alphaproteobacteria bacterium]|nr:hypothetical protein [Alphaproteobacteria bacterium]